MVQASTGSSVDAAKAQAHPPRPAAGSGIVAMLKRRRLVLLTLVILLAAWEIAPRALRIPDYLLPPPSQVLTAFLGQWQRTLAAAWITS